MDPGSKVHDEHHVLIRLSSCLIRVGLSIVYIVGTFITSSVCTFIASGRIGDYSKKSIWLTYSGLI